jgi:hypothetical protein
MQTPHIKIMKHLIAIVLFAIIANTSVSQKVYDPCQKLDTNTIKKLLIGTWVDMKDTTHIMTITSDSVEETIIINRVLGKDADVSYWNYKFQDNFLSTDAVTCYTLREYKAGYAHNVDLNINSVDEHYLLLGASGKSVFKKRN